MTILGTKESTEYTPISVSRILFAVYLGIMIPTCTFVVFYFNPRTAGLFIILLLLLLLRRIKRIEELKIESKDPLTRYLINRHVHFIDQILNYDPIFTLDIKTLKIRRILRDRTSLGPEETLYKSLLKDLS